MSAKKFMEDKQGLESMLKWVSSKNELSFVEIMANTVLRSNLGRPAVSPGENEDRFVDFFAALSPNSTPVTRVRITDFE